MVNCCQFWTCPDTGTAAIITRWNKYDSIAQAGCTPLLPCCGHSVAGLVNLRIQEIRHKIEAKVFILVHFSIQYRVIPERVSEAFYRLTNVQGQMESFIFDTVRAQVPMIPFDQVFLQKEEISKHIKEELSEAMESFGYEIINSLITDIEPSTDLKNAMNEIVRQERLKMAAEYQGETQRIIDVKTAEAEGEKIRIQAAADAEAKYLNGQGIARQRAAIITGMRDDVRNFSNAVGNVGTKDVLHLIILTQYLDTLRDVAAKSNANAVFVPQSATTPTVADGVRDGFLQASLSQGRGL